MAKLEDSQDFDGILIEENNKVKKNDNKDEDEKEIELAGGIVDEPDKDDLNDNNNEEENKSENTDNKKIRGKKKGKKGKKKKNTSNPNRKSKQQQNHIEVRSQGSSKNDRVSYFSDPVDLVDSASRFKKKTKKGEKEDYITDYILDKRDFNSKLLDTNTRGLCKLFCSMIKNNNTIVFIFFKNENDIFTRVSVAILTLSFYIFLNTFFMFNSSSLHLLRDKDNDLQEKTKGNYLFLNILVPSLLYIATTQLKKWTSIVEFINDKNYQHKKLKDKKLKKGRKKFEGQILIRIHDIITDTSKFKNEKEDQAFKLFIGGIIFLIFNWYYITCFLGIYENSYDCLILNIFVSLIFTLVFTSFIFFISSVLRYFGKALKNKFLFSFSQFLNPIYIFYNKLPYNDLYEDDDDDDDKDKTKEKEE